ncbi:MAG TPA: hypothetical protein VKT18_02175, partial [Acidimicrobiales bacterium]|nr:hypothetical protein [Acidimicrobiales bacterium]
AVAYNGTVSFSSSDPAAQLPGGYTFQASDKGTHTFSATLQTVGTWSIGATDTADKTITGTETPIVVIPRPVAALSVSGVADPLASGAVSDVVVKALYADGTVDPYYTGSVTFSTSDPSGTVALPAPYTFTAADMGVHRFSQSVRLQTAGTQTITATDSGHALAASQSVTVTPSLRVTSFTSTKAAVKGASTLSWTVGGAPTKLTLDPGGVDETGKTSDTATPFPTAPAVIGPRAFYRLTATNASYAGRVAELGSAAAIGGASDAQACAAAAFQDGGAVVTGYFTGTAMLGTTFLSSMGGKDVFVARYNADGSLAWATSAGGSGDDAGLGVAAFADGSCVVTGYFTGTATFGTTTLTSGGGRDAFVASLKADGTLSWAVSAGGTGDDSGQAIAGFLDGSVTVVGSFSGTASFGSSASVTSTGGTDVFVARYSIGGKLLWVRGAGGSGDDAALGVSIRPDGNSIVTGSYQAGATFGAISLPSSSGTSAFVACYRTDGVVAWAQSIAATGDVSGASCACFPDGSCAVTGRFSGSASFDASTTIVSAGGTDAFLARYAKDGTLVWALPGGGTGDDSASSVAAFPDGSAVVAGSFHGSATFSSTTLGSQGGADAFLACYDATGALVWAKSAGGAGDDAALGVAACQDGSSWLAGSFSATAMFGPGVALPSAGSTD